MTVVGYINDDATMRYAVAVRGDVPLSTSLGLLEMAKLDLYVSAQGQMSE